MKILKVAVPRRPVEEAKQEKVGLFVDSRNLFHCARTEFGRPVNMFNLKNDALRSRNVIYCVTYEVSNGSPSPGRAKYFESLEKMGFKVRVKLLKINSNGEKKGDWDSGITMDIMKRYEDLDTIIIASGDGDFLYLAQMLKQAGKRVEIISFKRNTSMELLQIADAFLDLGQNPFRYAFIPKEKLCELNGNHQDFHPTQIEVLGEKTQIINPEVASSVTKTKKATTGKTKKRVLKPILED